MNKKNIKEISDEELKEMIEQNNLQKVALEKLLRGLEKIDDDPKEIKNNKSVK